MLEDEPIKNLIKSTYEVFNNAISSEIVNKVPEAMIKSLREDIYVFSGMKAHSSMAEVQSLLLDEDNKIKAPYKFQQEVLKIDKTYNVDHLDAERLFATSSANTVAKWTLWEKDGDRYDLQFRTAGDNKVRTSHKALHDITLPFDDPFWTYYITPLGWRCRCNVVQVLRGKYKTSDSEKSMALGKTATTIIGKDGKDAGEIFRFNPAKKKVVFPPDHPYNKTLGANAAKKIVKKQIPK